MKTHQWKKGEYKIATNPNCTIENQTDTRKGYILVQVSRSAPLGLPAKEWHFPVFGIDNQMRSVTHIPTGLKLPGYFSRLRDAKAYAEALWPLIDWLTLTQGNATERFTPIKSKILKLMSQHGI